MPQKGQITPEERKGMLRQAKKHLKQRKLLYALVDFIIAMDWFNHNRGYFRSGDKVKYNWKAHIALKTLDKLGKTFTIKDYWCHTNVDFEEDGGAAAFWLRKLYPWERKNR